METIEDYIAFYSAIPEDKWCTGVFTTDEGSCCALGHLGERNMNKSPEAVKALQELMGETYISEVNDGEDQFKDIGDTPKERVINYLKNLKQWRQSTN